MRSRPRSALFRLVVAVGIGTAGGLLHVVPVRSQTVTLEGFAAPAPVALDDPWAELWARAPAIVVPLSAQNITPPFGGGSVRSLTARAMHDDRRIYLVMEWEDDEVDNAVSGAAAFSDAAAVQFPVLTGTDTPYTMGGPGTPVNIWQWKAVWQTDLEKGFSTVQDRYPDTYVDYYPNAGDPLYFPARNVGNPLAQPDHPSPVENLIAEGFGTLTSAANQDVGGAGQWRDGRWRVLFARDLLPAADGFAAFTVGQATSVAFAVWDGQAGERDGLKSIASFVDLQLSARDLDAVWATETGGFSWGRGGFSWLVVGITAIALAFVLVAVRKPRSQTAPGRITRS